MLNINDFFSKAREVIDVSKNAQEQHIIEIAEIIAHCMLDNGVVQIYGIDEDIAMGMELHYRAGGLMPYHRIPAVDLALRGVIDPVEVKETNFYHRTDIAQKLWDLYDIRQEDILIIYASAKVPISTYNMAEIAKANGHKLIVVGSMEALQNGLDKEIGNKLLALADETLDLNIPYPDVAIVEGDLEVAQFSGLVVNMFAQFLTAEIYNYLVSNGHEAPVLLSANITGADAHNGIISAPYDGRWRN